MRFVLKELASFESRKCCDLTSFAECSGGKMQVFGLGQQTLS